MRNLEDGNIIAMQNSKLSNITVGLYFHGGTIYENKKVQGISHLLEHLFYRRMYDLEQRDLYRELGNNGIYLRGTTYANYVRFMSTFAPDKFENFINIVLKIYEDFEWTTMEIAAEKEVVKRQIEEKGFSYFDYITDKNYYKGSILKNSISGETYQIDNLSDNIINSYKKRMFNLKNSTIIITGAFSEDNLIFMKSKLANIKQLKAQPLKKQNTVPALFCNRSSNNDIVLANYYSDCEVEIRIDIPININHYAAELLFYILAEGDGARLTYKLKDSLGYIGDFYASKCCYSDFGYKTLEYTVDNSILTKTMDIVFKELRNIKHDIKQEELDEVINFSLDFSSVIDSSETLNDVLCYHRFELGKDSFNIESEIESYKKITIDDLMDTAKILFVSKNISIVAENNSTLERKYKVKNALEKYRDMLGD